MNKLFMGIDGGGTGCRAVVADQYGTVLGSASGGPANIVTCFDGALDNIVQTAGSALSAANTPRADLADIAVVVGVAGANVSDARERLFANLPFHRCSVENDSTIAMHGALGREDGIVVTIGTGSIFVIKEQQRIRTIGGWGNVVSDQASGVWLGRRLLHDTLLCFDGIYPASPLYQQTMAEFNNSAETIVSFAKEAKPAQFATFAKTVMDHADKQDSLATRIVHAAVADIKLILTSINNQSLPVCLLGGLGGRYLNYLPQEIKHRLRKPDSDAVSGALAMAISRYNPVETNQ